MLLIIAIVLIVLWLLGRLRHIGGGCVHLLLIFVVIVVVVHLMRGRRAI